MLGAVLFGVGLALLIIWYKRRKVQQAVVEGGKYVIGRIANISRNYSVTINGVNPYVIECVFQDPDTEITHTFRSSDLMEDPSDFWLGHAPYNCSLTIVEAEGGDARITEIDRVFYDPKLIADYSAVTME